MMLNPLLVLTSIINHMEVYKGLSKTFTLPSGRSLTIREQNADDDEILSQIDTTQMEEAREEDIKNLNQFITQIVTYDGLTQKPFISLKDVEQLKLQDKYYILLISRIHSLGSVMDFKWKCRNKACKKEFEVEDDLKRFVKDFEKEDKDYKPGDFKAYPKDAGEWIEHEISSNKIVRFRYMTVQSELNVLALTAEKLNRNIELYARDLSIKVPETEEKSGWMKLSNLAIFSKAEIGPIRKKVSTQDPQAVLAKQCECPHCKSENLVPYTSLSDFFFPSED